MSFFSGEIYLETFGDSLMFDFSFKNSHFVVVTYKTLLSVIVKLPYNSNDVKICQYAFSKFLIESGFSADKNDRLYLLNESPCRYNFYLKIQLIIVLPNFGDFF